MRESAPALAALIALAPLIAAAPPPAHPAPHGPALPACDGDRACPAEAVWENAPGGEPGRPSHYPETRGPGGTRAIYLHCNITEPSVSLNASASDQLAVLTGRVTVDYITVLVVSVSLGSSVDLGWASAVQPAEMSFNAPGSLPFTVNVTVPGGTQNRSAVLTVRATATIQGLPSDSDQDTATIEVGVTAPPPVVPPSGPRPRAEGGVRLLNMPAIVTAVSLLAVVGTYLVLRIRRSRRPGAGAGRGPAGGRGGGDSSRRSRGAEHSGG